MLGLAGYTLGFCYIELLREAIYWILIGILGIIDFILAEFIIDS
ncbi:hypothetical protein L1283_001892 [Sphingobacterium sp. HSC-15S19]